MAVCWCSALCVAAPNPNPVPRMGNKSVELRVRASIDRNIGCFGLKLHKISRWKLNAGLTEVEPDLNEDPVDRWRTNSIGPEEFEYGVYDGHHTYFEGEKDPRTSWEIFAEEYYGVGPPTGFQGLMAWLFLPAVAAGMYLNVNGDYLFIGAAVFVVVFSLIEMNKPDYPHNFEPQIYNMERGARDKLINDYNTMEIWDFNEKYGELWDFTVPHDDIMDQLK
uniref:NAD(P)H dehydrogenase 18 n=1 Tax=Monsonia marlothii TaxID=163685 RepID=A0A0F7GZ14_9ROSI